MTLNIFITLDMDAMLNIVLDMNITLNAILTLGKNVTFPDVRYGCGVGCTEA